MYVYTDMTNFLAPKFDTQFLSHHCQPAKKPQAFGRLEVKPGRTSPSVRSQGIGQTHGPMVPWLATPISLGLSWPRKRIATELGSGKPPSTITVGVLLSRKYWLVNRDPFNGVL